jgi:hypothetical protein
MADVEARGWCWPCAFFSCSSFDDLNERICNGFDVVPNENAIEPLMQGYAPSWVTDKEPNGVDALAVPVSFIDVLIRDISIRVEDGHITPEKVFLILAHGRGKTFNGTGSIEMVRMRDQRAF